MYLPLFENPFSPLDADEARKSHYRFRVLRGAYLLILFVVIVIAVASS